MKSKLILTALATVASGATHATESASRSSSAGVGLLVIALVVGLAYLVVFLTRGGVDSRHSNPMDFDKFTTPSDRPSIERY